MLSDFSGKSFTHKGFHGVLNLFAACGPNPLGDLRRVFGDSYSFTLFFVHEDYVDWYWNTGDMDRLGKSVIRKTLEDAKFLVNLRLLWEKRCAVLEKVFWKIDQTDLSALSDKNLLAIYQELLSAYHAEYAPALGLQDAFSMRSEVHVEPAVVRFLKKKGISNRFGELYHVLFAPVEKSFLARERESMLKIALEIDKQGARVALEKDPSALERFPKIKAALHRHARHYFWIQNNYAKVQTLGVDYFLSKALEEKDPNVALERGKLSIAETKRRKVALIRQLKPTSEILALIRISELFSYMQDERKSYVLRSNHYQVLFLKEIARRKNLALKDLFYVAPPEVESVLRGRFDFSKTKDRLACCMVYEDENGMTILEGPNAKVVFDKQFRQAESQGTVLSGICANPGIASGPVKIIRKTHDLVNMKQGDVLVASMTRPEMLVAIKKAAAIVTDEGGITSHAAVVSRELGIPCLIGTKLATSVFKDGDWVAVDAGNSQVRKLH